MLLTLKRLNWSPLLLLWSQSLKGEAKQFPFGYGEVRWVRMSGSPRRYDVGSRWFLWAVHLETRVLEPYQSSVDLLVCPALVF